MTPRICLELWGPEPTTVVGVARHAERVGLDGVYLGESATGLHAETWTVLGAVAVATERLRLGPVIANLLPDYRSCVLLARQGATLAALSAGRFDFRTGVGADRSAGRAWWLPAGVEYPGYAERLLETERQLIALRALWNGTSIGIGSESFRLGLEHPPIEITVAASGARAMDLAGRLADRWETSFCTVDEWRSRAQEAPDALATSLEVDAFVGTDHDPDLVWRSVVADRVAEDLDALRDRALVGSPAQVAEQIEALAAAGVEQLVAAPHRPEDLDAVTRLAEAARLAR